MQLTINIPKRGQKITNEDIFKALYPSIVYGKSESAYFPTQIFGYLLNDNMSDDNFAFKANMDWWHEVYKGGDST